VLCLPRVDHVKPAYRESQRESRRSSLSHQKCSSDFLGGPCAACGVLGSSGGLSGCRLKFCEPRMNSSSSGAAGVASEPQLHAATSTLPPPSAASAADTFERLGAALTRADAALDSANSDLSALRTLPNSILGAQGGACWMHKAIILRSIRRFVVGFFLFSRRCVKCVPGGFVGRALYRKLCWRVSNSLNNLCIGLYCAFVRHRAVCVGFLCTSKPLVKPFHVKLPMATVPFRYRDRLQVPLHDTSLKLVTVVLVISSDSLMSGRARLLRHGRLLTSTCEPRTARRFNSALRRCLSV
jgi:hypothetical protein